MDDIADRLTNCFRTVFPELSDGEIPKASQASVAAWDSVATVTLVSVIEEEFGFQVDLELLDQLDSFTRIHDYLKRSAGGHLSETP